MLRKFGAQKEDFPIAEELAKKVLSLPIWPGMGQKQIDLVVDAITDFFNQV